MEASKDVIHVEEDGDLLGEAVVGRPVPEKEARVGFGARGARSARLARQSTRKVRQMERNARRDSDEWHVDSGANHVLPTVLLAGDE